MCLATNYTNQLLEIYKNIKSDVRRLKEEVSTANQFNLDMLHTIENTNFNACEGYMLAKQIKDNQIFRRQAKCELETLKKLKDSFIDANMDLLNIISQEIINEDNRYKHNIEYKVYRPRVMGKKAPDSVVKRPVQRRPKFVPEPIPTQTPVEDVKQNTTPIPIPRENTPIPASKTIIHKKTGEQLKVLSKLAGGKYLVQRKGGKQEIMNRKNISNLEFLYLQTAK